MTINGTKKKCIFFTLDEFRFLVQSLYEQDVYVDASLDGLTVGLTEDDLPAEDLHERLEKRLNLHEVTSLHIDDCDECGVWVVYKDRDPVSEIKSFTSVLLCLEEWSNSYPTGVVAYYNDIVVASACCDSEEEFEEFLRDHESYLTLDTELHLKANMWDIATGQTVLNFARKANDIFDKIVADKVTSESIDRAFQPEVDLLSRYSSSIKRITEITPLLCLPVSDKQRLCENKSLEGKVLLLEEIAERLEKEEASA